MENWHVVTTLKLLIDYGGKYMLFSLSCAWNKKEDLSPALKGNNSWKTYDCKIKVGNLQMVYLG